MANQDEKKDAGLMGLLIPLVAVTLLGGGGGWFLGFSMLAPKEATKTEAPEGEKVAAGEKAAAKEPHGEASHSGKADAHGQAHDEAAAKPVDHPESLQVKELPPIVTNLAVNTNWVRLQTAIVFDPQELKHAETLIPELMSDLTGFMNTLDLRDVEGPDGLRRLREELNERALIRSDHHLRELVIESLVIQ